MAHNRHEVYTCMILFWEHCQDVAELSVLSCTCTPAFWWCCYTIWQNGSWWCKENGNFRVPWEIVLYSVLSLGAQKVKVTLSLFLGWTYQVFTSLFLSSSFIIIMEKKSWTSLTLLTDLQSDTEYQLLKNLSQRCSQISRVHSTRWFPHYRNNYSNG